MVCSGVLVGLVLVSLLSPAVEARSKSAVKVDKTVGPIRDFAQITSFLNKKIPEVKVDKTPAVEAGVRNLARIISFLNKNYLDGDPFAVAINIPAENCSAHVKPDRSFLPDDSAWIVKRAMNGSAVYRGKRLIGAREKLVNRTSGYPPEYLLLIQSNPPNTASHYPLLKKLLNKDKHGCVVLYTSSSPCVNTCSTPEGPYSIIPALDMLKKHRGPKAFAFRQVRKHDEDSIQRKEHSEERPFGWCFPSGKDLYVTLGYEDYFDQQVSDIKEVNARVPIHRCDRAMCEHCLHENNEVDAKCMVNSRWPV